MSAGSPDNNKTMLLKFLFYLLSVIVHCEIPPPYSIGIASKSGRDQFATIQIVVNGTNSFRRLTDVEVPSNGLVWTDFQAAPGDSIEVRFNPVDTNFDLYYLINNGPGGIRTDIYDSRNLTFLPRNRCATTNCTFRISNFLVETWDDSRANVFINGTQVISAFNGSSAQSFNAGQNDIISIDFSFGGQSSEIGYSIQKLDDSIDYIEWYYDSYGSSSIIPNPYVAVSVLLPEDNLVIPAGEEIEIQLISEPQPGNFTVQLNCGLFQVINGIYETNTNETQNILIPDDFYGENCTLSVERPIYGQNPRSLTITQPVVISIVKNVTQFVFNSKIPILIISKAQSHSTNVSLTQICGNDTVIYDSVSVGQVFEASPSQDYVGSCSFSSTGAGPFQSSSVDLVIEMIKGTVELALSENDRRFSAGSSVSMEVVSNPTDLRFTVELNCGLQMIKTKVLDSGQVQFFEIPREFYGNLCEFIILAPLDLFVVSNKIDVVIAQDLSINLPEDEIIKPNLLILSVETPLFNDISEVIKVILSCSNHETEFELTTNENFSLGYSDFDYGNCSIHISDAAEYLNLPSPFHFSIKTQLEISQVPSILFNGFDFDILVSTVTKMIPSASEINLELICNDQLIQIWRNLNLNQKIKLKLLNCIEQSTPCNLKTTVVGEFYAPISKSVTVVPLKAPTGGSLRIIHEDECEKCIGLVCTCFLHIWFPKTTSDYFE